MTSTLTIKWRVYNSVTTKHFVGDIGETYKSNIFKFENMSSFKTLLFYTPKTTQTIEVKLMSDWQPQSCKIFVSCSHQRTISDITEQKPHKYLSKRVGGSQQLMRDDRNAWAVNGPREITLSDLCTSLQSTFLTARF